MLPLKYLPVLCIFIVICIKSVSLNSILYAILYCFQAVLVVIVYLCNVMYLCVSLEEF